MTELETHFGFELSGEQMLETTSVVKIRVLSRLQGVARLRRDQLQISDARENATARRRSSFSPAATLGLIAAG
jgi:hypothetical protein